MAILMAMSTGILISKWPRKKHNKICLPLLSDVFLY
jgi:hypothetical protein